MTYNNDPHFDLMNAENSPVFAPCTEEEQEEWVLSHTIKGASIWKKEVVFIGKGGAYTPYYSEAVVFASEEEAFIFQNELVESTECGELEALFMSYEAIQFI